jgi:VanZ like family
MRDPAASETKMSWRRDPRVQAVVATLVLCCLLFSPGTGPALVSTWSFNLPAQIDKVVHALFFGLETLFLYRAWSVDPQTGSARALGRTLLLIFGLAIVTELGQALVPGRAPELLDIAADLTGAGLCAIFLAFNEWFKPRRALAALE